MNSIRIAQYFNIVGIGNFISVILTSAFLTERSIQIGIIMAICITFSSVVLMMIMWAKFQKINNATDLITSSARTFIYKYLAFNPFIALILISLLWGAVYQTDFIKLAIIILIILAYPMLICWNSVSLSVEGETLKVIEYGSASRSINLGSIISVTPLQFGLLYKIKYVDELQKRRRLYFFPKGSFLFFNQSSINKQLREILNLD